MEITLRPSTPGDEAFLQRVYASTREAELALVDWDDVQKAAFLDMQFNAQHRYYHEHYPDAAFQVIVADDQPVGRLYVDRWPDEIRIIDIALLLEWRNAGIGTALLESVLREASQAGKPVRIHVERFNPAMHLYQRLGFAMVGEHGIYYLMERLPGNPVANGGNAT